MRYDYSSVASTGVKINLSAGNATETVLGLAVIDTLSNIEKVVGSNWDDKFITSGIVSNYVDGNEGITRRYRDWETDRKSTRLNSSHITRSRMPSSA